MRRLIYHNDPGPRVEMLLGTSFANITTLCVLHFTLYFYILHFTFHTLILHFTYKNSHLVMMQDASGQVNVKKSQPHSSPVRVLLLPLRLPQSKTCCAARGRREFVLEYQINRSLHSSNSSNWNGRSKGCALCCTTKQHT